MKGDVHQTYPKKDDSLLFSTSLIFEQSIDKLWIFLRDLNNEVKIIDYLDNLQYIKGDNTWNKGNIFSINWVGFTPLNFKCKTISNDKIKKLIKWKVAGDIGIYYYKKVCLYRITQTGQTLVKSTIWKAETENDINDYKSTRNYYLNLEYNILLKKSNYLKNLKEDNILFHSCIIKSNFLKVLNFIFDVNNVNKIWGINGKIFECNKTKIEEGAFFKLEIKNHPLKIFYKIIEIKVYKKKKNCKIKLEAVGANIKHLPKLIEYKIIRIDENRTQFSILNNFKYDIDQNILTEFKTEINRALEKYKLNIEE